MSSKITTPYPLFNDVDGRPLDAGFVFIGEAGKNPEVYPISVFWDENLTVPAEQPIRTRNGYFAKNGRAGKLYVADADCSITAKNKNKIVVHTDLFADLFFGQKDVVKTVETINDLKYLVPWDGRTVYVKGYYKATNFALAQPYKGGGTRIYVASRSNENDGFLCINGWVLQIENNAVTPEQAGTKCDGVTDDVIALNKAVNCGFNVELGFGTYAVSKPVRKYKRGGRIAGTGELTTKILKTTNGVEGFGVSTINGKKVNFNVDAVLILMPDLDSQDWYAQNIHCDGFSLQHGKGGLGSYELYAPLICMSSFKNITGKGAEYGVFAVDSWMVKWDRVQADAWCPFAFGYSTTEWLPNCTSQTFESCWASGTKEGYYAYDIRNMQYSNFISSACDYSGSDGSPADGIWNFISSDVNLINCGCEYQYVYNFLSAFESRITLKQGNFQTIYNKYKKDNPNYSSANAMFRILSNSTVIVENARLQFMYNSANNANCSAMAYVEGGSSFAFKDGSDTGVAIEGIAVADYVYTYNKFGIYYDKARLSIKTKKSNIEINTIGDSDFVNDESTDYTFRSLQYAPLHFTELTTKRAVGCSSYAANGSSVAAGQLPSQSNAYVVDQVGTQNTVTPENSNVARFAHELWEGGGRIWWQGGAWGSNLTTWREIYTTANTTVDANGFVKKASPIVQLYADKIEINDEAKEQDIAFEKVDIGHYLIKGSSGLSNDGWYIEQPRDANGNLYHVVEFTTLENSDIEIKTFDYMLDKKGRIVADHDAPIDIQGGRFISIRLNDLQITKVGMYQP